VPQRPATTVIANGYALTDLGTLVAGGFSYALGINANGYVVGAGGPFVAGCCGYPGQSHGFLWDPSTRSMTDLGVSTRDYGSGIWSVATGINAAGVIAGYGRDNYWSGTESVMSADPTSRTWATYAPEFEATGINGAGVVVGSTPDYIGSYHHAFAFDLGTQTLTDLGLPAGGAQAGANGINDLGTVAGYTQIPNVCARPVTWDLSTGSSAIVPLPAGATCGTAYGIGPTGIVVGGFSTPQGEHAFAWDPAGGTPLDLGTLGGAQSRAYGVNRQGHIVGWGTLSDGTRHAFVWDPAPQRMIDLGAWRGDVTSEARAINDADQVVGMGDGGSLGQHALLWTVTFANVAPTVSTNGTYDGDEGTPITFSATGSADAAGGALTYTWDFGDGTPKVVTTSPAVQHTYTDNPTGVATYNVALTTTDPSNMSTTGHTVAAVHNVPPTATFTAPAGSISEGAKFSLSLAGPTDPSSADVAAGFSYAFDCGGGYGRAGASADASCSTTDNGVLAVRGKVIDKDGGYTEYTANVTVVNVAPSGSLAAPATAAEGSAFTLTLTASDASPADLAAGLQYAFDCGDGSGYRAFSATNSSSCVPGDNGTLTVQGKVRDKDGDVSAYTATVTVSSVAPTATLSAPAVTEGTPITLSLSNVQDPSGADRAAGFTYAFDCTGNGSWSAPSSTPTFTCPAGASADGPLQTPVAGKVIDKDGAATSYKLNTAVNNVAPSVTVTFTKTGMKISASGTFSDPGVKDAPWTYQFVWGDGTSSPATQARTSVSGCSATQPCTISPSAQTTHQYKRGTYSLTLVVTDKDGARGVSAPVTVTLP
jgi:probable HAF family extracellular repeat protein